MKTVAQTNEGFVCNGKLINTTHGRFYVVEIDQEQQLFSLSPFVNTLVQNADAIGYRWADQTFYGVIRSSATATASVFALKSDGSSEIVAAINAERPYRIFAGAVTNNQRYLVLLETRETDFLLDPSLPTYVHKINLEDGNYTQETITVAGIGENVGIGIGDIAFDPITDICYGFDGLTSRLVTIDIENDIIDNASFPVIDLPFDISAPHGLFFDPFGRLYGTIKNPNGVFLFEIDKNTGSLHSVFQANELGGTTGGLEDGCSCPFTVAMEQTVSQDTFSNCQEFEAVARVAYLSSVNQNGLTFRDSFPPGCQILEILRNPYGGDITGLSTNVLTIQNISPEYGVDSLVLRVFIPEDLATGLHSCQASLVGLDLSAANDARTVVYSDYPPTKEKYDSTPFFLKSLEDFSPQTEYEICFEEEIVLKPLESSDGFEFQWADGTRADSFRVDMPGDYALTISNACEEFPLSIHVENSVLEIDLGEDQELFHGQSFLLEPQIMATGLIQSYQWASNDTTSLSCLSCPENNIMPSQELTTVGLTVTNEAGCTATDEVRIHLVRPVYGPNAFSPNNDGINDYFFLQTPSPIPFDYFRVFDRWGGLVFEKRDGITNFEQNGWSGFSKGTLHSSGLYIWVAALRYNGTELHVVKGEVLLLN